MARRKNSFKLNDSDKSRLSILLTGGNLPVRETRRALCLINLDQGRTQEDVAGFLGITVKAVFNISKRYKSGGLERALHDESRPGKEPLLSQDEGNKIIAMVTSQPPDGFQRWSIRLIASEAKVRQIVKTISKDTVYSLLRSHDLKPWREKNVVHSKTQ